MTNLNCYKLNLDACHRCCSTDVSKEDDLVSCNHCGFSDITSNWQIKGWRDITVSPPVFGGHILAYGKQIGRVIANWDRATQTCSEPNATHWLRVPDPRKQVNLK